MGAKITIIVISSLLVLITLFLSVYYLWPWNKDFFNNASEEFSIPGLDTKFCPQGMTRLDGYDGDNNHYLISGYMTDGSPSRFYVVNSDKNTIEKWFTLSTDGLEFTGHVGGVTCSGSTIWTVAMGSDGYGKGYRFTTTQIQKVDNAGEIELTNSADVFNTYNGADFVFTYDGYLWVGEFYKKGKYETKERNRLVTRSGEINPAVVMGFQIDEGNHYGLTYNSSKDWNPFPSKAISIRGLCQGIDVTGDGKFVLSTSWGLSDSNIYLYDNVLSEPAHNEKFIIGQTKVPLWYLDGESLISKTNAPAMSEEIFVKNERVYILFESACKKYKLFNRKRLTNVYSLPLSYLENQKNS